MKNINWVPAKGYEGLYEVNVIGEIRSIDRVFYRNGFNVNLKGLILKQRISLRGYYEVKLSKNGVTKTVTVHSIVAKTFLPKRLETLVVNHKDGNKMNNNVENLEWIHQEDNMRHAFSTGLIKRKRHQYDGIRLSIVDKNSGETFSCLRELCEKKNLNHNTMRSYLLGIRKNKTNYEYRGNNRNV